MAAAKPRKIGLERVELPAHKPDPDKPEALTSLFGEVLSYWSPRSFALLGSPLPGRTTTPKSAGMDVSFWYLDEPGDRYIRKCSLCLNPEDLTRQHVDIERVKLVHAPLLMDHLHQGRLLEDALALVAPGGAFSVILESAAEFEGKVSRGDAPTTPAVRGQWSIINPVWLGETLGGHDFRLTREWSKVLNSGRKLWMGVFSK